MMGNAVLAAAANLRADLLTRAAARLGADPSSVTLVPGAVALASRGPSEGGAADGPAGRAARRADEAAGPDDSTEGAEGETGGSDEAGAGGLPVSEPSRRGRVPEDHRRDDTRAGPTTGPEQQAPTDSISLSDLVPDDAEELSAEGEFRNAGGLDPDTGQGVASSQWNQSAVAAQVVVDPQTGKVEVEHVHAAVYAGRVVNPAAARLQTEGNVVMGVGSALFEEVVFEEGQVVNANLSDYPVPSLADAPARLTVTLLERPGAQVHGLGETALPPTPAAVGNAVAAALGLEPNRLPLTPERILAAAEVAATRGAP
jgi:CO/xanthine dehydrogenase Mo-binding subunit